MRDVPDAAVTAIFERDVLAPLAARRRRLRACLLLHGLAAVLPAMMAAAAALLAIDRAFKLPAGMRALLLFAAVAAVAGVVWRRLIAPLRLPLEGRDLAALIERGESSLRDRLVSAVELHALLASGRLAPEMCSPSLVRGVLADVCGQAERLARSRMVNTRRVWRDAVILVLTLGAVGAIGVTAADTVRLWFLRGVLLRNVPWPQRTRLVVEGFEDGRRVWPRGDDFRLAARVAPGHETPRQVFVDVATDDGRTATAQMLQLGRDRFEHVFPRVASPLRCRVRGGDDRGEWLRIDVVDRPAVERAAIRVEPPAYAGLPPHDLREGSTLIEALAGSRVEFRIRTNKPIVRAELLRGETVLSGAVERRSETEWIGRDAVRSAADYRFRLTDGSGLGSESERTRPLRLSVRITPDRPPRADLKVRGVSDIVTPDAVLPVRVEFFDTYGLASAEIVAESTRLTEGGRILPVEGFEPPRRRFERALSLPLQPLRLQPTDRLSLYARAADFDDVNGPNVGKSPVTALRVVTREEFLNELSRREQQYCQEYERIVRAQEDLYAGALGVLRTVGDGPAGTHHRGEFGRLERSQRQLAVRLGSMRRAYEQLLEELQTNQALLPAERTRLGEGIVAPLGEIVREAIPAAIAPLERLAMRDEAAVRREVPPAQERLLAGLRGLLASMRRAEGFHEALSLLRDVIRLQTEVNRETEQQAAEDVERLFGTTAAPATQEVRP